MRALFDVRGEMKTKLPTAICVLALTLGTVTPSFASDDDDPLTVIADTVIVRPGCIVATAIGSVCFVIALPFAAASKSIRKTARTLVVKPARAAFTRPIGDMEALKD